jgi:predicted enzyme related to lactoylglutathione lyase
MARIRHLAILTEDVETLVKFYTTAFGLKIINCKRAQILKFDLCPI